MSFRSSLMERCFFLSGVLLPGGRLKETWWWWGAAVPRPRPPPPRPPPPGGRCRRCKSRASSSEFDRPARFDPRLTKLMSVFGAAVSREQGWGMEL